MRARTYTLAALLLVMMANGLQAVEESPNITITSLNEGDWIEGEVEILVDGDVENLELLVNGTVVASANAGESLIWDTRDANATSPAPFQVVARGELENGTQVESSPINVMVLYPRQLTYDPAMDIQPEWHPDGGIFVFKSNRGEEEHIFKLYTLIPGEEPEQIQTDRVYHGYPGWSPDGSHMVFNSYDPEVEGTGEMDIFVVNLSSGESIPVTTNSDFDDSGRWSPDGNFISFHSSRSGDLDVWKVAVADNGTPIGEPIRLTPGDSNEHCPRWSFDGEWLVFWGGDTKELNQHHQVQNQRFAFDFLIADNAGKTHKGKGKKNEDYFAFAQTVLAPADGIVTDVITGVRDNTPGSMNPFSALGNTVVIEHHEHEVSVLAHFKQGSIRIKPGDKVKKGQILGLCGNSGNSSEPHLHFHLQNTPIIQDGTGVKCLFDTIRVTMDGRSESRTNYSPVKGDIIKQE